MLCHNYCSWSKSICMEFAVNNATTVPFQFSVIPPHLSPRYMMALVRQHGVFPQMEVCFISSLAGLRVRKIQHCVRVTQLPAQLSCSRHKKMFSAFYIVVWHIVCHTSLYFSSSCQSVSATNTNSLSGLPPSSHCSLCDSLILCAMIY